MKKKRGRKNKKLVIAGEVLTVVYRHAYSNCAEGQSTEIGDSIEESEGVEVWQLRHEELDKAKNNDTIWQLECVSIRVVGHIKSLQTYSLSLQTAAICAAEETQPCPCMGLTSDSCGFHRQVHDPSSMAYKFCMLVA